MNVVGEDANHSIEELVGGSPSPVAMAPNEGANRGKWNDHASRDQMRIKWHSHDPYNSAGF